MALNRVAILAISMVLLSSVAMAADHIVGDDKGWTVDFNYTQWTQDKVFRVGDNLVFNYDNTKHNIFKVNGTLFKDCTFPPKNEALSTGKDIIQLKTEGRKWYVCGVADHCSAHQMKFVITVLAEGAPAPSPPPSSNAHSIVSSMFGVVMVAIVAMATIFA
ncbi:putative cupredoxin [Medicago truncatula]|uniref:Plastocyanin-like domain protein n=1 Tax=Medicago truncatula TaxID=3880 RepID=G7L0I0_MEDTR|nr:blue copper protein 1a-like [Medicago truncatula]AES80888.1 plastocyanin-like domain protein [Medicago truncatula]RHN47505.1 putative cupredoxin [Medicago truncatula]